MNFSNSYISQKRFKLCSWMKHDSDDWVIDVFVLDLFKLSVRLGYGVSVDSQGHSLAKENLKSIISFAE